MSTRDAASAPPPPPSPGGTQGDAFDMLKNMWSLAGMATMPGMQASANPLAQMTKGMPQVLPNLLLPTFDVDELDKRITDLRAVEQWLQLNASMLRATIQALELQRATLTSMQQFGNAMMTPATQAPAPAAAPKPAPGPAPSPATTPAGAAALDPTAWWHSLQQQFSQIAAATAAGAAAAAAPAPAAKTARKRATRP